MCLLQLLSLPLPVLLLKKCFWNCCGRPREDYKRYRCGGIKSSLHSARGIFCVQAWLRDLQFWGNRVEAQVLLAQLAAVQLNLGGSTEQLATKECKTVFGAARESTAPTSTVLLTSLGSYRTRLRPLMTSETHDVGLRYLNLPLIGAKSSTQ